MRQLFSKSDLRTLAMSMALVIMSAGLSLSTGVTIVFEHSEPELTADACQPLQSSNVAINLLLMHPVIAVPELLPCDLGPTMPLELARVADFGKAPDTPPQKLV